ncbi:hypothetical protein AAF712_015778 [Marasmius tenuissimus]|uniref:Uncharacterized protein n=1 Tax=Marasmius tenuissimus TaxID=585030 RepID=A0ABR2Z9I8_9AGAR
MASTYGNDGGRNQFTSVEMLQLLLDGFDGLGGNAAPVRMPEFPPAQAYTLASEDSKGTPSLHGNLGAADDHGDTEDCYRQSLLERLEDEKEEIERELRDVVLARNRVLRVIDWQQRNVVQPDRIAFFEEQERVAVHRRAHWGCRCKFPVVKQYRAAWKESKYNLKRARGELEGLRKKITHLDHQSQELDARIDKVDEEEI